MTYYLDTDKHYDGHEDEENGPIHTYIVGEIARVASHFPKQRSLGCYVGLGKEISGYR